MKTKMKQLAAGTILALLLVVGNVQAKGTEIKASSLEITETALSMENWMINDKVWNAKTLLWVDEVADENLIIENWMTSDRTWNKSSEMKVAVEEEKQLELENWMTNNNVWNR